MRGLFNGHTRHLRRPSFFFIFSHNLRVKNLLRLLRARRTTRTRCRARAVKKTWRPSPISGGSVPRSVSLCRVSWDFSISPDSGRQEPAQPQRDEVKQTTTRRHGTARHGTRRGETAYMPSLVLPRRPPFSGPGSVSSTPPHPLPPFPSTAATPSPLSLGGDFSTEEWQHK